MILHFLRRVSLCLWISLLIAGFGSFWFLAWLQPEVGSDAAPFLVAGLLTAVFAAVGWAGNRLGMRRVQRLMQRADRAEREGRRAEAEDAFQGALGVLDSFWVSPRVRQRILMPLAGRIARFYLSESHFSAAAEDFVVRYLSAHPQDEEVAEQWVRHAERQGGLREEHQGLADRLGNAHPLRPIIQHAVARLCLASERTDYPALRAYRRVCAEDGRVPPEFCADLARLLRKEDRSDDWSRQVLRQAEAMLPSRADGLLAPTQEPAHPAGPPEPSAEMGWPAPPEEEDRVFRVAGGIAEVDEEEEEMRAPLFTPTWRGAAWAGAMVRQAFGAWEFLRGRLQRGSAAWTGWLRGLRGGAGMRRAWGLLLITGIVAGGGWAALDLAGVFGPAPNQPSAVEPPSVPALPPPDPFALQVAAYLKQDYALRRVEDLKKKGLDAYWVETASSGKTWYQVRIARFADPQSAREFGRSLKGKGIIDDFYVTSSSR
jgi:hypothetical protein